MPCTTAVLAEGALAAVEPAAAALDRVATRFARDSQALPDPHWSPASIAGDRGEVVEPAACTLRG